MRNSTIFRVSLLAAALGAALSAHAVSIGLSSVGTYDNDTASGIVSFTEAVVSQKGGFGPLATLTSSFDTSINLGGGTYTSANGVDKLFFLFAFDTPIVENGTQSISGVWAATGGTGAYLNATGSGTIANVVEFGDPVTTQGDSYTTFRGKIQAVPEPASVAALGVGALALLRRRKRA